MPATNNFTTSASFRSAADQGIIYLKKKIWEIQTMPKIRLFLWRTVSGALTVADRLQSRGLAVDMECKLCIGGLESINHVIFQCIPAQDILRSVNFSPEPSPTQNLCEHIYLALELMSDSSTPEDKWRAIPWLLWTIWKDGNLLLYDGTQISTDVLTQQALEEAMDNPSCPSDP